MEATLQGIFRGSFAHYAKTRRLPLKAHKAAQAIMDCRSAELGGHVQRCPAGHVARVQYNSCKHRSCPRCAELPRARWATAQQQRLLACDHYHVVFTVPHELLDAWQYNQHWFADTLFQVARDTLMSLLGDERFLGALPGMVMSLHTWGRNLSLHPHVHCLVSGGGLTAGGQWKPVTGGYLLPVRVVEALYKGKLLAALWQRLKSGELRLGEDVNAESFGSMLKRLNKKRWNVRIQERYPHGRGVMIYLSRYVKGGPLTNRRIQSASTEKVTFRYTDHRDGKTKAMDLSPEAFIGRMLRHIPEKGQHTIRHFGLYAHQARGKRALCREQLGQMPEPEVIEPLDWQDYLMAIGKDDLAKCPACGSRMQRGVRILKDAGDGKNSIAVAMQGTYVQQGVGVERERLAEPIGRRIDDPPPRIFWPLRRPLN